MDEDREKIAPTVSIETVIVVRPMKVVAVLMGFVGILLMVLVIGASSWVHVSGYREGLWDRCYESGPGRITCQGGESKPWLQACRALCILAAALAFVAGFITSKGLTALTFRKRYRCYFVAMLIFFLAVIFNMTSLIIFPVKYDDELERLDINDWTFGWAYGLGWVVSVMFLGSAFLLWLDKDTDEIIFREKTSYNNEGIEEVGYFKHHVTDSPRSSYQKQKYALCSVPEIYGCIGECQTCYLIHPDKLLVPWARNYNASLKLRKT